MKLAKPKSARKSIVVRTTPQPVARATQESSALLAVVGITPAILTETVWALAQGKPRIPPVIPDDVVAITTRRGAQTITEQLLTANEDFGGLTVWQALRRALLGSGALADSRLTLHVRQIGSPNPATGQTEFLEDIRTEEQNLVAADFILQQVREQTVADDRRLIASLAGGRKTMSALLHAARARSPRSCESSPRSRATPPSGASRYALAPASSRRCRSARYGSPPGCAMLPAIRRRRWRARCSCSPAR